MVETVSLILGSSLVSTVVTFFTTRRRYCEEIKNLKVDNFSKTVERYQQILDDMQTRYESAENRYASLVEKYNVAMDINLKLQSEIQTLKIQIRKLQKNE